MDEIIPVLNKQFIEFEHIIIICGCLPVQWGIYFVIPHEYNNKAPRSNKVKYAHPILRYTKSPQIRHYFDL